jgi:hypothetical protein
LAARVGVRVASRRTREYIKFSGSFEFIERD